MTQATDSGTRVGGTARWSPRVTPPIGAALTSQQALACAFRILARAGFSENLAGHITWAEPPSDNLWVNPWGKWWSEVQASDVCLVSPDADVLSGPWDVTPAIHLHTELHRRRADARVVVHNHPYWATLLASIGELPRIIHQTACMYDGDLVFIDEYDGEIDDPDLGQVLAERIGDASVALLANHGVIVTGPTLEHAIYRAASLDRQCRLTYDALLIRPDVAEIPAAVRPAMKASLLERAADVFWAGSVRQVLRDEPDVLE
ncbi:MAG TPA: class II aldolase/adducin family protein [Acidimicrobiia bacterium]|nr:class II aldolase/adducin family protein [Acidimicrobiia bacterium]